MTRIHHTLSFSLCPAIALLIVAGLPGSQRAQAQQPRRQSVVPAVRAHLLVSTEWLMKYLKDPKVVVLHVARDKASYDAGHIPGARFLPLGEILATRDGVPNELPPVDKLQQVFSKLGVGDDSRVVLYGEQSGLVAARAYFTLDYLGFGDQAALLDGGLEKWKAEKREVSTAAADVKAAKFTPRVNPKVLVVRDVMRDASWVASNVAAPNVALIDARPAEDYTGAKTGDGLPRSGHIPGAANIYWMQELTSKENPTMLPASELRKMYEAAGATAGKKVVTYCRTGMQASHAYFTAKYLGYDAAMYDGSFIEWSKTEGLPVATGQGKEVKSKK
ncbi:MAG TPA: sulfurtransferase [Blastocatellia bacterium]|nr:sulfurtransferase [Blastocatellia bacterium]